MQIYTNPNQHLHATDQIYLDGSRFITTEIPQRAAILEQGLLQATGNATLAEEEISALNLRLVEEQTGLAEVEARLRTVESLLQSPDGVESASEVLNSTLIINLREQEAALKSEAAELAEIYGDRHPQLVNKRAELRDLRQNIGNEVNKLVQGLRNEASITRSRPAITFW